MRLLTGLVLGGILAAGALGAALSQTRIDPKTGAQVPGSAAPTTATGAPTAVTPATKRPGVAVLNRAPSRGGQVDWKAAIGGLRQCGGGNPALNLNQAAVDM